MADGPLVKGAVLRQNHGFKGHRQAMQKAELLHFSPQRLCLLGRFRPIYQERAIPAHAAFPKCILFKSGRQRAASNPWGEHQGRNQASVILVFLAAQHVCHIIGGLLFPVSQALHTVKQLLPGMSVSQIKTNLFSIGR